MRRVLLDTNVVIWALSGSRRLRPGQAKVLVDPRTELLWSAVVTTELTLLSRLGKLAIEGTVAALVERAWRSWGFRPLAIDHEHALALDRLPLIHRDPFDRILAAQALVEDVALVSSDARFDDYGVRRIA